MRFGIYVLTLFISASCSSKIKTYKSMTGAGAGTPKKTYVEDQVLNLQTSGNLPKAKQFFVEITDKEGQTENGKLINISEADILIETGYRYTTIQDSVSRTVARKTIAKQDILIMKVW